MTSLLRSELLKLRSTRTTIGLLLAAFALTLLVAFVHGYSTPKNKDEERANAQSLVSSARFLKEVFNGE